jgi:hypothetical protein
MAGERELVRSKCGKNGGVNRKERLFQIAAEPLASDPMSNHLFCMYDFVLY